MLLIQFNTIIFSKLYEGIKMLLNVLIEKDKDGYFARILELDGCVSQGDTYEEALFNIKEAGELYLESLQRTF